MALSSKERSPTACPIRQHLGTESRAEREARDYAVAERKSSLMNTVNVEVLLTANELAQRWSLSQKTLANHRCNGTGVSYVKIGVAVRYQLSDVIDFEKRVTAVDAA